jgi:hypothetical protein
VREIGIVAHWLALDAGKGMQVGWKIGLARHGCVVHENGDHTNTRGTQTCRDLRANVIAIRPREERSDATFWDAHEAWNERVEQARKRDQIGDLLILADEAPVAPLRAEAWITAGIELCKNRRYKFALEQLERGLDRLEAIPGASVVHTDYLPRVEAKAEDAEPSTSARAMRH